MGTRCHLKARKTFYCSPADRNKLAKPSLTIPFVKDNKQNVKELRQQGAKTVCNYPSTIGGS